MIIFLLVADGKSSVQLNKKLSISFFKVTPSWGTWMAQLSPTPDFGSGRNVGVVRSSPRSGSVCWAGSLLGILSLPVPSPSSLPSSKKSITSGTWPKKVPKITN